MAKTNWKMDDTVMPDDLNQIGQDINELKADGSATDDRIGDRTINDTVTPTSNTGKLTPLLSGLGNMVKAITGEASWRTIPSTTIKAIKTILDAATNAATANTIIKRDANGRAKVAAPSASDDIARKAEVDGAQAAAISAAAADATSKANAIQTNLNSHAADAVKHITAAERTAWNGKAAVKTIYSNRSIKINSPLAHYNSLQQNETGTIKLTLPVSYNNTFIGVKLKGQVLSNVGMWELMLYGYNLNGTPAAWNSTSAVLSGRAPFDTVRFGHDGTKCCILLGTTSTVWSYPQIVLEEALLGWDGAPATSEGTWNISLITSETGITINTTPVINAGTNVDMVDGYHVSFNDQANTVAMRGANSEVAAKQFKSTAPEGMTPLTVISSTRVPNLNADTTDGFHFDQDVRKDASPTFSQLTISDNLYVNKGIIMNGGREFERYLGSVFTIANSPNQKFNVKIPLDGTGSWSGYFDVIVGGGYNNTNLGGVAIKRFYGMFTAAGGLNNIYSRYVDYSMPSGTPLRIGEISLVGNELLIPVSFTLNIAGNQGFYITIRGRNSTTGTILDITKATITTFYADSVILPEPYVTYNNLQLTGVPTAPTAVAGTNNKTVANTEFVDAGFTKKTINLADGTDLNTVVTSGFYRFFGGIINGPAQLNVSYSQMIVSRGRDTIAQIVISFNTNRMFYRSGNPPEVGGTGAWLPWKEVADTDWVQSFYNASVIPANADLNTATYRVEGQFYTASSSDAATVLNRPSGVSISFNLRVYRGATSWYIQELTIVSTRQVYQRQYNGDTGTWLEWLQVPTATTIDQSIKDYAVNAVSGSTDGTIDPNTTQLPYIVSAHSNSPQSGYFWHIHTFFYSSKFTNRSQLAIAYNGPTRMFIRQYFNSAWSAWREVAYSDQIRAIATQAQAEAGTDNATDMTPLRTTQAITKRIPMRIYNSLTTPVGASNGDLWFPPPS